MRAWSCRRWPAPFLLVMAAAGCAVPARDRPRPEPAATASPAAGDAAPPAATGTAPGADELQADALQDLSGGGSGADPSPPVAVQPQASPVPFASLFPFLPAVPPGWMADDRQGSLGFEATGTIHEVLCSYTRQDPAGGDAASVMVLITDGAFIPSAYAPWNDMPRFLQETGEQYVRRATLQGFPAFETWSKAAATGEVMVLVADRYLVRVSGKGVEPAVVREWAQALRLVDLANLD